MKIKFIFFIFTYLLAPEVFAGIFDPPPTDKSVQFLGLVLGSNVGDIYLGGTPNPVLVQMISKLNSIIIAIGTVILSYIGIVSMINTAQEGTAMGKKWSSVWIPMRSLTGMLMLVPTPATGYSIIQVTVLWVIIQGIGAADIIWNLVLDNLSKGVSATANLQILGEEELKTSILRDGSMAQEAFKAAVCIETVKQLDSSNNKFNQQPIEIPNDGFIHNNASLIKPYITPHTLRPTLAEIVNQDPETITASGYLNIGNKSNQEYNSVCGRFQVEAEVTKADAIKAGMKNSQQRANFAYELYIAKQDALRTMITNMTAAARQVVLVGGNRASPGAIQNAANAYIGAMSNKLIGIGEYSGGDDDYGGSDQKFDDNIGKAVEQGKQFGWIAAGSYYFVLNQSRKQELWPAAIQMSKSSFIPKCDEESCNTGETSGGDLAKLNDYLDNNNQKKYLASRLFQAKIYITNDSKANFSHKLDINVPGGTDTLQLLQPLMDVANGSIEWLINQMSEPGGDPLLGHAHFGSKLMIGAELSWISVIVIGLLMTPLATCAAASPTWATIFTALITVGSIVLALLAVLWTVGASMAIYVPLIPYMMFTVSALGWLLLVVEAIIAAPIMALGLVVPSQDEIGKIAPGLGLLANILLRPMLMIFGFILAARVYRAVVDLVDFGMATNFKTIQASGSLLSPIAAMILYAVFVMALANKCFALIHILPDKVLRWIGISPEQTDVSALQETKSGYERGEGQLGKAGSGATSGSMEGIQKKLDKGKEGDGNKDDGADSSQSTGKGATEVDSGAGGGPGGKTPGPGGKTPGPGGGDGGSSGGAAAAAL